jgi:hypothetical protein
MTSTREVTSVSEFDRYLAELCTACERHANITGLVLMGSTADRSRVDEWSDHDFAVIAPTEALEPLRGDLSWLPRPESIVASAREWHDGFKVIYAHGAVIEFAVTDLEGLSTFHANAWEVAYGGEQVASVMRAVAGKSAPAGGDVAVFLTSLLVGVGRARRGEVLSAGASVRGLAMEHLLVLLRASPMDARLDDLDPRRRFELVHPVLGQELGLALEHPVEQCARLLLHLAERELRLPALAVAAVKTRLGWA